MIIIFKRFKNFSSLHRNRGERPTDDYIVQIQREREEKSDELKSPESGKRKGPKGGKGDPFFLLINHHHRLRIFQFSGRDLYYTYIYIYINIHREIERE